MKNAADRHSSQGTVVRSETRPRWMLLLSSAFIFLSLLDPIPISNIPLLRTASAVAGMTLAFLFMLLRLNRFRLYRGPQALSLIFITMMIVWELIRVAGGQASQLLYLMQWIQLQILFIIFIDLGRDRRAFHYLWGSVVAAILALALINVIGVPHLTEESSSGRSGLAAYNLNRQAYWYGLACISIVWLMVEMWRKISSWQFVLLALAAASLAISILTSGSRGALLTTMTGLTVLLTLQFRERNKTAFTFVVPALVVGGIVALFSVGVALRRITGTVQGAEDQSRLVVWESVVGLIREYPIMGYGPEFMRSLSNYGQMLEWEMNSHNSHLQVAAAFGLPALLIWWALMGSVFLRVWRERRKPAGALFCSLIVASLVYSFTSDLGFNRFFWIMIAVAANVRVLGGLFQEEPGRGSELFPAGARAGNHL